MPLDDITIFTLLLLGVFAFSAGFIDAVVGGGGLIQMPALLINLPNTPLPTVFGTGKIAALAGTSIAAYKYAKKVVFDISILFAISVTAFVASFFGSKLVSHLNSNALKPLMFFILVAIAIYTFIKKDLGAATTKKLPVKKQIFYGVCIGLIVGFYDGFFGPGTGSFFVLGFVAILGFDFLKASAYAKVINCVTNIASLFVFITNGNYILYIALTLAIFNMAGNFLGSHIALKKGNSFIRKIFLGIVCVMICRYGYDVFKMYYT